MADHPSFQDIALNDIDFEAVYRGDGPLMGEVQFERPPWDIDAAQPVVIACADNGEFTGKVLDIGSGTGNNSIFLAERGYSVLGVDGSSEAIAIAGRRASARGVDVRFQLAEATTLDGVEQQFDTVLDSALYHCLPPESRKAYSAALHRVTNPGARLHILCFSDAKPMGFPMPGLVSEQDLRTNLSAEWDISSIELTTYVGGIDVQTAAREFAKMGPAIDPDALPSDASGNVTFPVWHLRATRS